MCHNNLMNRVEWQRWRARLNHDWLKNWLIPALSKLLRVAKGQIADQRFFVDFSGKLRCEWPENAREFKALAEAFPHAMSPENYFDEEPLSRLPSQDAKWMREVTHQLWLRSFPVEKLRQGVIRALKAANDCYNALMSAVEQDEPPSALVGRIEHFQRSCKALGDAVSEVPAKPEFSKRLHG